MPKAEQWNKETIVTFTSPVEVPSKILPPGTYVFKLAGSQSDRQLVQILMQDQRQVLASIQAIPDYHVEPAEKTVIALTERPAAQTEALQSWFYPGEKYGVRFVYPNSGANQRKLRQRPHRIVSQLLLYPRLLKLSRLWSPN